MVRLSCIGFGILGALALLIVGNCMQLAVVYTLYVQWPVLKPYVKYGLTLLLGVCYMLAFFFQQDSGDDVGGYAIRFFLGLKPYSDGNFEQLATTALLLYPVLFYWLLFEGWYRQGVKDKFTYLAIGFAIPLMLFGFFYMWAQ